MITARCENLIPGFRKAVEYVEVGTPLSVKRYTLNPEGAVYGFAQNPGKSTAYLNALPPTCISHPPRENSEEASPVLFIVGI